MRMIAAATLILIPLGAAPSQPRAEPQALRMPAPPGDAPAESPLCDRFGRVEQARDRSVLRAPSAAPQRLDRLPTGRLDLAVLRQLGDCPEPATIAENFGAVDGPRAVRPPERTPAPPRSRLLGR